MPTTNQRDYYDPQTLRRDRIAEGDFLPQNNSRPQNNFQQAPAQQGGGGFSSIAPLNLPDFSGIQAGGGTSIDGVGSVQAGNQVPLAQTIAQVLGGAYGDQLGLMGSLFNTQGGVQQAQIGADASNYGIDKSTESQQIIAQLQKDLGIYQSDQDLAGTQLQADASRYGADQGLAGTQAQAEAAKYGADQGLAGTTISAQYGALPAYFQQQRFDQSFPFFQELAGQLLGGGGGIGPVSLPGLDASEAINRSQANNAATEAAALNSPGYSGGSPQAGAASQRASLQRAMADTGAATDIATEYARENREAKLAALAAENDRMRAMSSQMSPLLSLLGQYA